MSARVCTGCGREESLESRRFCTSCGTGLPAVSELIGSPPAAAQPAAVAPTPPAAEPAVAAEPVAPAAAESPAPVPAPARIAEGVVVNRLRSNPFRAPAARESEEEAPVVSRAWTMAERAGKRQLSRERKIAGDLPDWEPLPPGELVVKRTKSRA